jgi:hypothetical protein
MDGSLVDMKKHPLTWALGVSLLMHLLFLFVFVRENPLISFFTPQEEVATPERRIRFEIIESPEDVRRSTPDERTHLLSDRTAAAQNRVQDELAEGIDPYAEGLSDIRSLPQPDAGSGVETSSASTSPQNSYDRRTTQTHSRGRVAPTFSREKLLEGAQRSQNRRSSSYATPLYRQVDSRVRDFGDLRFNTYAWDFAPYLLYLKQTIRKNIYPPPVFTHMGFGGRNAVQFRIYPDGRLEDVTVLGHQGEQALVETSVMAVRVSAPFRPLPEDFPEDYLEVTAGFGYIGFQR